MYSVTIILQRVAFILLYEVVCYLLFHLFGEWLQRIGRLVANRFYIRNLLSYFAMSSSMLHYFGLLVHGNGAFYIWVLVLKVYIC